MRFYRGLARRRAIRVGALVGLIVALGLAASVALAAGIRRHTGATKPSPSLALVPAARPQPASSAGPVATPSHGAAPSAIGSLATRHEVGAGKPSVAHKPAPALLPARGTVVPSAPSASTPNGKAEVGGRVNLGRAHPGAGRLIIPAPSAAHPATARRFTPSSFYSSTQLDNFSAQCGFGVNETTIAQSTDNPNLVVAGANSFYDNSGNCQDSHAGVYYSSDGGQNWQFEVMPGLLDPASGDPVVTYDPVRHVFLFAFVEFNRSDATQGRIGVEASADGVNWSRNTTLDSNNASYGTDKPSITVDQNPSSPHYGRVAVAWTQFFGNNAIYQEDYTDDGGASWNTSGSSVNFTSHECGNGTAPAFDANGDLMVAWADCSGGTNSIYEELSTTGGQSWTASSDTQITTTSPLAGAEDPNAADCFLNNGGTAFRCNSFPTLAGDPNSSDAGGSAFLVGWADVRSTTQNAQTANVSQIMGLSTVNGGSAWGSLAFLSFNDFGDKFFPAASFSPSGRLTVSFSSRESSASSGNPNGRSFSEHQTEASSLSNLRAASYVSYTTDGTSGDPGTLSFIGDYAGNTSLDSNFDTFPIWTDLRSGFPSARTQDLCYADCMTFLSPATPLSVFRSSGTTFTDFYRLSLDPTSGSGSSFWNVVAMRTGTDGSVIDDDTYLAANRYYNTALASSALSPPRNDYLVINGNSGHAPNTVYFPQVDSFSTVGGAYSVEWDAGQIVINPGGPGSMAPADVARVYDAFLNTGTNYFFGLRPAAGNTSLYSLTLHVANAAPEQGRSGAVKDVTQVGTATPTFFQYNTGADPSQYDGVVVVNNNSGAGSYSVYRDAAAPSGTITIGGGAPATNSTALHLGLSATNPTAGDPVSDMAFSINGGAYGAFRPYSTTATVTVAAGEGPQTVAVKYRNGAGAVSTPSSATIWLTPSPPVVSSLNATHGSTAGGNVVTITGQHLAPGSTVSFGSTASGSVTFVSATQLRAVAPAQSPGAVNVTVTTPAGTSSVSSADVYTYGPPTITAITPSAGPTTGATTVTIAGAGFAPGTTVKFGSTPSSSVTVVSGAQLRAVAPAGSAGAVQVSATTPGGTSVATAQDIYTYVAVAAHTATCVVPKLKHKTLAQARRALRRAHCKLGRVRRPKHVRRHHVLRVVSQGTKANSRQPANFPVRVRVR